MKYPSLVFPLLTPRCAPSWWRKRSYLLAQEGCPKYEPREADLKIREAIRRNEVEKIRFLWQIYPQRPFEIESATARKILGDKGFRRLGFSRLLFPPEGMSRRQAKRVKDRVLQEARRESRKRIREERYYQRRRLEEVSYDWYGEEDDDESSFRLSYEDSGFSPTLGDVLGSE